MYDPDQVSKDRRVREAQAAAQAWSTSRALVERSQELLVASRALCNEVTYHAGRLVSGQEPRDPEAPAGGNS